MNKKTAGKICALICMASVVIYFIWGMIAHSYHNAWIIFMVAGISCAGISMFAGGKKEKTGDNSETGDIIKSDDTAEKENPEENN